jgi:hypothetical protein
VYECGVAIGKKIDRLAKIIERKRENEKAAFRPITSKRVFTHAITCGELALLCFVLACLLTLCCTSVLCLY